MFNMRKYVLREISLGMYELDETIINFDRVLHIRRGNTISLKQIKSRNLPQNFEEKKYIETVRICFLGAESLLIPGTIEDFENIEPVPEPAPNESVKIEEIVYTASGITAITTCEIRFEKGVGKKFFDEKHIFDGGKYMFDGFDIEQWNGAKLVLAMKRAVDTIIIATPLDDDTLEPIEIPKLTGKERMGTLPVKTEPEPKPKPEPNPQPEPKPADGENIHKIVSIREVSREEQGEFPFDGAFEIKFDSPATEIVAGISYEFKGFSDDDWNNFLPVKESGAEGYKLIWIQFIGVPLPILNGNEYCVTRKKAVKTRRKSKR